MSLLPAAAADIQELHDTIAELEDQLLEATQAREEAERVAASSQRRYQAELKAALSRAQEAEAELHALQQQQVRHRIAQCCSSSYIQSW